ncbi:hypothetical protein KEM48_002809 [Puccinia striiformis f. sp. tritici PST-130]|nr:hypothetical protein KEM48_002809 [Puccinia striiformis f. sp. tritici PST-130]
MAIATDNLAAAAMFREQAIRSHRSLEGLMTTDVLTLLTEGWNPITARLPRTAGEPTIRQNRTQPYQRRARGPHPVQESNSPTLDTHRQQAPTPEVRPPHPPRGGPQRGGNGRMRNRPEYRALVFDEIFEWVGWCRALTTKEILEILFSKIEQVVDGNSERAVAQIQKSLPTLSVSLSRELSTLLSSKISLLQDSLRDQLKAIQFSLSNLHASCNAQASSDKSHLKLLQDVSAECISLTKAVRNIQNPSNDNLVSMSSLEERMNRALRTSQDEVVAHLASKPECDSAKLVQVIQELDVRVHRVEALVEANLHKETEFPYVHSSEPVSSGIDTARIQTIVENTMSKHIACLESVLITRLNQTTRRETDNVELSEDLEQKLEIHSENQHRATGQFRSGEARLRDEVVELSQLIRDHGSQTRQETTTSPPVQNRRMPQSTGQGDDSDDDREPIDNDLKKQLLNAIAKSDWPTFSGEGEYDLVGFCRWIDAARLYSYVDDKVIVLKLLTMLTGSAHGWFDTARLTKPSQKWKFWRAELWKKYGTSTWKHKIEDSFDADKFVPGEVSPATWVTRQYNRLQCFAPDASQEAINFKLLRLVDNEVEYAAKTAMRGEETRLGRKRFPPKSTLPSKPPTAPADKPKISTSTITCYTCNETGHTTRSCPKRVRNIQEDEPPQDEDPSDYESDGPIIGDDSKGALVIEATRGRNNLVRMTCCNLDCMVLLDSGAVSSVVGKHYLQRFCPGWRDFILPVETGKFHSASGTLIPLGVVHIKFFMKSIELKVRFVVMDNMSAKYFILGNDYLVAYKISLLNKERRQFTMGSKVFDFDESINAIEQTTTPESSFVSEVMNNAKLSPMLSENQNRALLKVLYEHSNAFATADQPFGAVRGHEVEITLTIEKPYPPA